MHVSVHVWGSACINRHPAAARRRDKGKAECDSALLGLQVSTWVELLASAHKWGNPLHGKDRPLSVGSFPPRSGKNCAFADEEFCRGNAMAQPFRFPSQIAYVPAFSCISHCARPSSRVLGITTCMLVSPKCVFRILT